MKLLTVFGPATKTIALTGLGAAAAIGTVVALSDWSEPSSNGSLVRETTQEPSGAEISTTQSTTPGAGPQIDIIRVEPDGATLIAGATEPNARVELRVGETTVAHAQADAAGEFVVVTQIAPAAQPQQMRLALITEEGEPVLAEEGVIVAPIAPGDEPPILASVEELRPVNPDVSELGGSNSTDLSAAVSNSAIPEVERLANPLVLLSSATDVTVSQNPAPAPHAQDNVALHAISYTSDGEVVVTGTGPAEARIEAALDGTPIQLGEVSPSGAWSLQLPQVDPGTYTLSVAELAPDGREVTRIETPFLREDPERITALPDQDALELPNVVTVQPGFTLWGIAQERLGEGLLYVQIYQANKSQILDPHWIYPGQIFDLPEQTFASE